MARRGRKPEHERNLKLYQTLLAEGHTRGAAAIDRAVELLDGQNVTRERARLIIIDGKKRHRSGWKPPEPDPEPLFYLRRQTKLKGTFKKIILYLLVCQSLGRGLSLRRAAQRVQQKLGIPAAEILSVYEEADNIVKRHAKAQRQQLIKLAARVKLPHLS